MFITDSYRNEVPPGLTFKAMRPYFLPVPIQPRFSETHAQQFWMGLEELFSSSVAPPFSSARRSSTNFGCGFGAYTAHTTGR